jgi:hypothetical protein
MEAVPRVLRANTPRIFRLVTREAGAVISSEILKERVFPRYSRSGRLEACNGASGVAIYLQPRDERRGCLRVGINIGKQPPHLLRIAGPRRRAPRLQCRIALFVRLRNWKRWLPLERPSAL